MCLRCHSVSCITLGWQGSGEWNKMEETVRSKAMEIGFGRTTEKVKATKNTHDKEVGYAYTVDGNELKVAKVVLDEKGNRNRKYKILAIQPYRPPTHFVDFEVDIVYGHLDKKNMVSQVPSEFFVTYTYKGKHETWKAKHPLIEEPEPFKPMTVSLEEVKKQRGKLLKRTRAAIGQYDTQLSKKQKQADQPKIKQQVKQVTPNSNVNQDSFIIDTEYIFIGILIFIFGCELMIIACCIALWIGCMAGWISQSVKKNGFEPLSIVVK